MQNYIHYAIYARVAFADSGSEEKIQEQIRIVEDHLASTNCHTIACVYTDFGISGHTIRRTGLDILFADAEAGEINTVICTSADRLGHGEACDLLLDNLEEFGIKFVSVDRARQFMDDMWWSSVLFSHC